eukprot:scaffold73658_cov44-Tisochrysis_lutea.AAC.2
MDALSVGLNHSRSVTSPALASLPDPQVWSVRCTQAQLDGARRPSLSTSQVAPQAPSEEWVQSKNRQKLRD